MAKTYREMVYIIMDELRILSDDTIWENEHFVFILNKYRALLFKQRYSDRKREIPSAYYQTLNIECDQYNSDKNTYQSKYRIPNLIDMNNIWLYISSDDGIENENFNFINPYRFKTLGYNKWLNNKKYCTIGVDNYYYLKLPSSETQESLSVNLYAVLDNPIDINSSSFLGERIVQTDPLDCEFPVEEALVQPIIDLCLKEIGQLNQLPRDILNNAMDDSGVQSNQNQNNGDK